MSLDGVRKVIDKMDAISNYEEVVDEKSRLSRALYLERKRHADEIKKLNQRISSLEDIKIKYNESEYSLEEFEDLIKSRFEEFKEEKMKKQIGRRWKKEAPRLIEQGLINEIRAYPDRCRPKLKELLDSTSKKLMNELLSNKDNWPEWFIDYYASKVEKAAIQYINEEFLNRVEFGAERRLQLKVLVEWPKYLEEHITPFCRSSIITQLQNMMCTIDLSCNKCGTITAVPLTPEVIADIIKKPKISIDCSNLNCRHWGMPRKVELTLGKVIYAIVNST